MGPRSKLVGFTTSDGYLCSDCAEYYDDICKECAVAGRDQGGEVWGAFDDQECSPLGEQCTRCGADVLEPWEGARTDYEHWDVDPSEEDEKRWALEVEEAGESRRADDKYHRDITKS